jgi:hypothetical protein
VAHTTHSKQGVCPDPSGPGPLCHPLVSFWQSTRGYPLR